MAIMAIGFKKSTIKNLSYLRALQYSCIYGFYKKKISVFLLNGRLRPYHRSMYINIENYDHTI